MTTAAVQGQKAIMEITDTAATKIKQLLESEEAAGMSALRVGVKSRGCSGLMYHMEYAEAAGAGEEVIKKDGATVFVDPMSVMFLIGTTMDFVEEKEMGQEGFVFNNPNEKAKCGCGESFYAEGQENAPSGKGGGCASGNCG